jgi:chromosome segregation ATPase
MIKKSLMAGVVLFGVAALLYATEAGSYAMTYLRRARHAVKNSVPLDIELDRARGAVTELLPDIRQNMHVIAEEEVEVAHLRESIAEANNSLGEQRDQILTLRRDLDKGDEQFHYAGRTYHRNEVKTDLARRFERFRNAEEIVKSKEKILAAREKSLQANRDKLEGMIAARRDLEVQVENLEARLRMVQAAQTSSNLTFDDSQLARAKKLIGDLRKRLDVSQRMLDAEGRFTDLIPLDEASVPEDILEQIDEHFSSEGNGSVDRLSVSTY